MLENEELEEQQEWESTETAIIEEVKTFAKRSAEQYKDLYKRMRSERAFAAGEQWTDADDTNRGNGRAKATINLCSIFINAVVNPFSARPFKFKAVPRWSQDEFVNANAAAGRLDVEAGLANVGMPVNNIKDEIVKLNERLTALQNEFSTNESNAEGLYDSVSVGLGFTYATIDEENGEKKIKYLHIEDQTMVIVDPDAKGVALEQADRIGVVDFMGYEDAKDKFGDDIVRTGNSEDAKLYNFGSCWEVPKDHVAIITYFRKEGHSVEYFRLCGDHIVDYGVFEGLDYLPVFAFTGDRIWLKDKRTFAGMIRKIKAEQKTINYAQSQLIERLAKSPKGFFIGYSESFEGNEAGYQNAHFGNNMVVEGNLHAEGDSDPSRLPLPQYVEPHVLTDDLQAVINASINQMSVATGISPNGIVEQNLTDKKTATEVLLRTKTSQSNVSNYIDHAKETIRISGTVLAHLCIMLYGIDLPKGSYDIVVEEGCVSLTKMEEDREKLLALAQIVPESFKPLITTKIVRTLDIEGGNELSQQLFNMLPAELRGGVPSWQEFQAQAIQMQQLQQQIAQMQAENKQLNDQLTQAQLRTTTDLIMEDKKFEHQVQLKELDFAHDQQATAQDMVLDAKKEQFKAQQDLAKQAQESKTRIAEKVVETTMAPPNVIVQNPDNTQMPL